MHDLCGVSGVCSHMVSVEWVCGLHGLYGVGMLAYIGCVEWACGHTWAVWSGFVVMHGLCGVGLSVDPSPERILLLLNLSSFAGGASAKLPIQASHKHMCEHFFRADIKNRTKLGLTNSFGYIWPTVLSVLGWPAAKTVLPRAP